ncbi:type II toxin-antitoxin system RatA family toxin [Methylibium petroleiphilum]|uniref:type II toxin-antitoxin system RatA family toxin n=1 Tax=Methylibium petroleiphilum TaxID=105560 RepID=UPI001ACF0624|nr:type II toxin-antitoxin system RatA family toxin [Methylibium petroleiphilum]MBN9203975.1 type II toxin-antitoxin system RatA family toxin [Methylibium petroleiphilum]
MKHVKKSVLLWYSAQEMYALVTDVPAYPQFLPWCDRTEVLESTEHGMTARLHLAYHGVRHAFTTRNEHVPGRSVVVSLVDGPFSQLEGVWQFVPLGAPADDGATPRACRVELDLRYAFSSLALEAVVSPVFDRIANTLVDSFVKRAEQVHGPR